MSQDHFKVIYTGEIKEEFEVEPVAISFAAKFKISPEKALKIIQSGNEITLNKKSKHVLAYKLKSAFEEIGMQIRLERILLLVSNEEIENQENNKEKEEKKDKVIDDKYSENNKKLNKASETWTLDPMKKEEEPEPTEIINDDPKNKVKKNDFNYTGLLNSPVIGKQKKTPKTSEPKPKDKDNSETQESFSPSEEKAPLKRFLNKIGITKFLKNNFKYDE